VPSWGILLGLIWWSGMVGILASHLGVLLMPVALYGLVLGAAAVCALATRPIAAVGALIFLVSDTLLALDRFLPGFAFPAIDFSIMLTYTLGQGLIIVGVIAVARVRAGYADAGALAPTPASI
jgi:uncharacterized membrane protein YhhN